MANPFGFGQTYIPQYQQGASTPTPTSFSSFGSNNQQSGAAQGFQSGMPGDMSQFVNPDQSLLPGLQKEFNPNQPLDANYFQQYQGKWGNGVPGEGSFSVNYPTPLSNIPDFTPGKDPFSAAQAWYTGYVNNLNNYQQNYLPGYKAQLQNDYNAYRGENNSSAFADPTLRAPGIAGLDSQYKSALQAASQKYLELYNQYGQTGAFGSNFKIRTAPVNFGG